MKRQLSAILFTFLSLFLFSCENREKVFEYNVMRYENWKEYDALTQEYKYIPNNPKDSMLLKDKISVIYGKDTIWVKYDTPCLNEDGSITEGLSFSNIGLFIEYEGDRQPDIFPHFQKTFGDEYFPYKLRSSKFGENEKIKSVFLYDIHIEGEPYVSFDEPYYYDEIDINAPFEVKEPAKYMLILSHKVQLEVSKLIE